MPATRFLMQLYPFNNSRFHSCSFDPIPHLALRRARCAHQVDHTLVEFNKLISLVGITLLLMALLLPASAAALQVIYFCILTFVVTHS